MTRRHVEDAMGADFGPTLEHFVLMELCAFRSYREADFDIAFWRTKSGLEVDYVLDRGRIAIEVKGRVRDADLRPLRAFGEEFAPQRSVMVCNEQQSPRVDGIEVLPRREFLGELWSTGLGIASLDND